MTITGNQGVDVCCAGRQCVPLSVYTNSVLWLGLGRAAQSRRVQMTFQTVYVVFPVSLLILSATYRRAASVLTGQFTLNFTPD